MDANSSDCRAHRHHDRSTPSPGGRWRGGSARRGEHGHHEPVDADAAASGHRVRHQLLRHARHRLVRDDDRDVSRLEARAGRADSRARSTSVTSCRRSSRRSFTRSSSKSSSDAGPDDRRGLRGRLAGRRASSRACRGATSRSAWASALFGAATIMLLQLLGRRPRRRHGAGARRAPSWRSGSAATSCSAR